MAWKSSTASCPIQNRSPRTVAIQTDDEKRTYLFRTKEVRLRDRLEDVAEGISVVGDDDFVLAPSRIDATEPNCRFVQGRAIGEIEIAEPPKGLLDLIAIEPGNTASQTLERIAVEDVASARLIYEKAKKSGTGRFLDFGGSRHAND